MRNILFLVRSNRVFLILQLVFLTIAGIVFLLYGKPEIHLYINKHYSAFGDLIMPWFTWLGDGWTVTGIVLLLFAINRNFAFFTGIACLVSSGFTQLLKHTVYYGDPRPAYVFHSNEIRMVPGIINDLYDTFPSGHTTVAFALYFCLCIGTDRTWAKVLFFFIAFMVGYSRIYLSQHFLEDVYAGSIIGTVTSLLIFAAVVSKEKVKLPALK